MTILNNNVRNRLWISAALMIIIFCILGLPFTKWGFKTDDWANIFHSQLTSWGDVQNLFTEGNMESINHPSGTPPDKGSFLQGLYRPLSFIFYYPQTLVFGTQAYGYFLVTVLIHAINTGLFFLMLTHFFSISVSLLAALFFGFHPSLQNWLGWISAQTYFIELLFLSFIFIAFYQWIKTDRVRWYLLAVTLFFINLLLKEATILLPAWIFFATLMYSARTSQVLLQAFKNAVGFGAATIMYCLIRLTVMPFSRGNTSTFGFSLSWQSFITKQIARTMQFVTYVYDILGLTWLPKGNRSINGLILLGVLFLLLILFIKSRQKKVISFCLASTLIFSWPGLLMHYQPRYMYMAIPWVLVACIILLQSIDLKNLLLKKLLYVCVLGYITASGAYVFANMKEREYALHWLDTSMRTLVTQDLITAGWQHEPLCFFNLPEHWFAMGTTQAVWFLDHAKINAYEVYQVTLPTKKLYQEHARQIPLVVIEQQTFSIDDVLSLGLPHHAKRKGLWPLTWDYTNAKFKILPYISYNKSNKV